MVKNDFCFNFFINKSKQANITTPFTKSPNNMAYTRAEDGFDNRTFDKICTKKNVNPSVFVVNNHYGKDTNVAIDTKYDVTRMFYYTFVTGIPFFARLLLVSDYLSNVYGKIIEECDGKILACSDHGKDKTLILYMGKNEYANYKNVRRIVSREQISAV